MLDSVKDEEESTNSTPSFSHQVKINTLLSTVYEQESSYQQSSSGRYQEIKHENKPVAIQIELSQQDNSQASSQNLQTQT